MSCTLIFRGGDIELHHTENFNKIRHRVNKAKKQLIDYQNGNIDGVTKGQKFEPAHVLSFRTAPMDDDDEDGGRITIDVESYIGVISTEPKDVGGGGNGRDSEQDDEYEDEDDDEADE